ncbi:F-box and associated interaction domains-containing protein [Striga asiatica]|uniref:F-box and associated interaction domains-containing protein n=1 Tax=Striga asiatica TaxID=4170 RepID=A0A5A7P761_STRAF|nr:F-box and associated interaction domains-containing protein [Striga asiatica]
MSDIPPAAMNVVLPEQSPLPLEVIENILSRLPVRTLKRFRAVEKSWCSLIDAESFAKAHLRRSLSSPHSNRNLISGLNGFCFMSLAALTQVKSFKPAFKYDEKDEHAISNSVNGMVVVMREPARPVLWNPFTGEHKVLPACPREFQPDERHFCRTTYGFGYDPENDDYKIIKVMLYMFKRLSLWSLSEDWIYSLRSNSWKRTNGAPYTHRHWPAHVNGILHTIVQTWTGPGLSGVHLYGFSLVHEKDYEVKMPQKIEIEGIDSLTVDAFEGRLSLGCAYESRFAIWVMVSYGVWNPLIQFVTKPDDFLRPLAFVENGNKLLLSRGCKRLVVCDLVKAQNLVMPFEFSPLFCLETLVSPHAWDKGEIGRKNLNIGKSKKKKMKMKKKKKKRNKKWTWSVAKRIGFYHLVLTLFKLDLIILCSETTHEVPTWRIWFSFCMLSFNVASVNKPKEK